MTAIDDEPTTDNEVFLRGRLAAAPDARTLPSGAEVWSFRLTVSRPPEDQPQTRSRLDTIDCAAVTARVRRCLERAAPGDQLEVTGSLHRRFWRGASGLGSRYEVVVRSARRVSRPSSRRQTDA